MKFSAVVEVVPEDDPRATITNPDGTTMRVALTVAEQVEISGAWSWTYRPNSTIPGQTAPLFEVSLEHLRETPDALVLVGWKVDYETEEEGQLAAAYWQGRGLDTGEIRPHSH